MTKIIISDKGTNIIKYYLYRHITEPITKLLLKTKVKADHVTYLFILLAFVSGITLALGYIITGVILHQLSIIFDWVDGDIARARGTDSLWGKWLDGTSDRWCNGFVYIGGAIGIYHLSSNPVILILGMIVVLNSTMISSISQLQNRLFPSSKNKKIFIGISIFIFGLDIALLFGFGLIYYWFLMIVSFPLVIYKYIINYRKHKENGYT